MKSSLIIVGFFVLGVFTALFGILDSFDISTLSKYTLYLLLFTVGLGLGLDKKIFTAIRKQPLRILILPLGTMVGTFAGAGISALILSDLSIIDTLAIGSGFGYYSLSSIFLNEVRGPEMGAIALAANIIREIITLLLAPILVKYFGKLAPISAGGATTMDTTLPIIAKVSGNEYVPISIFHGIVMDLSVPFFLTIFISLY